MVVEGQQFAAQYERDENGWIHFPRDIEYRRTLYPNKKLNSRTDVFAHPAKMNLFLVQSLVDYISDPGDWIGDPFGGTGSTAICTRQGRSAFLIDVEEEFGEIIKEAASILVPGGAALQGTSAWSWLAPSKAYGEIRLVIGDNRKVLRDYNGRQVDAIITSPPYSTALNPGSNPLEVHGREGTLAAYSKSAFNLSQLNPFFWEQALRDVWKGCANWLKPGGIMAVVNKDIVKSGRREMLSIMLIREASKCGLKYREMFKWAPPGTIRQETARNKGGTVIEDEDIILFERE